VIILSKSICYTFFNLDLSWGVGGVPPHFHIVCFLNREVCNGRRYDFWDIVDTISELAKPYKNVESILKKRTDSVCKLTLSVQVSMREDKSYEKRYT
jgi:hypothetical protein